MALYVKKPVIIEASQFHALGDHPQVVADTVQGFVVEGRQGSVRVDPGDWILPELNGQGFYPCKPDVFEATYQAVESPGVSALSFGDALAALRGGERVCRAGWNGKGMWLSLSGPLDGREIPAGNFWSENNAEFARANGGKATVLPCITMKTASGEILMGWLASQTDMLADDWMVVSD